MLSDLQMSRTYQLLRCQWIMIPPGSPISLCLEPTRFYDFNRRNPIGALRLFYVWDLPGSVTSTDIKAVTFSNFIKVVNLPNMRQGESLRNWFIIKTTKSRELTRSKYANLKYVYVKFLWSEINSKYFTLTRLVLWRLMHILEFWYIVRIRSSCTQTIYEWRDDNSITRAYFEFISCRDGLPISDSRSCIW